MGCLRMRRTNSVLEGKWKESFTKCRNVSNYWTKQQWRGELHCRRGLNGCFGEFFFVTLSHCNCCESKLTTFTVLHKETICKLFRATSQAERGASVLYSKGTIKFFGLKWRCHVPPVSLCSFAQNKQVHHRSEMQKVFHESTYNIWGPDGSAVHYYM